MTIPELESMYEAALRPIFGADLRIVRERDDLVHIMLDGDREDFFFTHYGVDHVRLYWCNECFIFCAYRNDLAPSYTYGEIVYEGALDVQELPQMIVDLILHLRNSAYLDRQETVTGKIPSGYDDVKDYTIRARTDDPLRTTYRLSNILIEYER